MYVKIVQGMHESVREITSIYECATVHVRPCDDGERLNTHVTIQMEDSIDGIQNGSQAIIHVRKENSTIWLMNALGETIDTLHW